MISYELSLTLSIVGVLMVANTLSLAHLVTSQQGTWLGFIPKWNIFLQPVAFFIYVISAIAETNRLPFDLAESEQELVAGWHTEYSSMKFAMFMLAEYANMVTVSALATIMFLGGWSGPFSDLPVLRHDSADCLVRQQDFQFSSLSMSCCAQRFHGFDMISS